MEFGLVPTILFSILFLLLLIKTIDVIVKAHEDRRTSLKWILIYLFSLANVVVVVTIISWLI